MAKRPIFCIDEKIFCKTVEVEFEYFNGFSLKQKRLSITSLHKAAQEMGIEKILEISSKSPEPLGQQLSAFNLLRSYADNKLSVESLFQGSKVFEHGGPYQAIYFDTPLEAKRNPLLKNSGDIVGFEFEGVFWPPEPKTAFYEWLYISTIVQDYPGLVEEIDRYEAFSDIEFNPKKSINCQARAAAILVSLHKKGLLEEAVRSKENFLKIVYKSEKGQKSLF